MKSFMKSSSLQQSSQRTVDEELEMRKEMLENYKEAGVMDNLKANLRKQIVDKIQAGKPGVVDLGQSTMSMMSAGGGFGGDTRPQKTRFLHKTHKIYGYLIADYLRTYEVNFTFGVFLPEMRINSGQILLRDEICDSFMIEKNEYSALELSSKRLSALEILVDTIRKIKKNKKIDQAVQTENFNKGETFYEKLDEISRNFMPKLDYFKLVNKKNAEEPFDKFRKECEEKYKSAMLIEIDRIRNIEIMELRNIEAHRYHEKLEATRTKYFLTKGMKKMEDLEKIEFDNRQRHLNDIDILKNKEIEFRRHNCLDSHEVKEERQRLKQMENQLKNKIKEYETSKEVVESRTENDFVKRREIIREEQRQNDARSREIQSIMVEEQEYLKQQKERTRDLEYQRQVQEQENESLKQNIRDINAVLNGNMEELRRLRENQRKLTDNLEEVEKNLDQERKLNKQLLEKIENLTKEFNEKNHEAQERQSARRQLQQNYDSDLVRYNIRLSEAENNHRFELSVLKQQIADDNALLKREKKDLEEVNLKLDCEASDLRRELRFLRKKLQEANEIIENQKQEPLDNKNNKKEQLKLTNENEQPPVSITSKRVLSPLEQHDQKYRKNLDDIFKEMEAIKEKAQREFLFQP